MSVPNWHAQTVTETLKDFSLEKKRGLSSKQVRLIHEQGRFNELPRKKSDAWWIVFVRQFISPLIVILVIAAVISGFLHEWVDFGVIVAAVVINTIIGFVQEYKANRALEHLRSLVQPRATVLRDGKEVDIAAREIVDGDILVLHTGDQVTADARVIMEVELLVNESALTGESLPQKKEIKALKEGILLADRTNMVYAGTSVVGGRAHAVVVGIGLESELGKIASLVEQTEEGDTPLQGQLSQLARWIAIGVVGIVAVLFVVGIWRGATVVEMFELSVALSVAAIPEGLIVSVTIILAIGMQRILRRRSLVRRLVGAETLGSVSVICTDKTGTITEGEMRVTHLVTPKEEVNVREMKELPQGAIQQMLQISLLCNDVILIEERGERLLKGSPTERALLQAALDAGLDQQTLQDAHPRQAEIPFDSAHKYMVTQHAWGSKSAWLLKGAPSRVLAFASHYQKNGRKTKLTDVARKQIAEQEASLTAQGLRLIAYGIREGIIDDRLVKDELEGFTFLGFVGLRDPLRPEAVEQIRAAKAAGVRTVMITGDHPQTARAIGAEAGLVAGPESVVVGSDLDEWSDEELERRVGRITIYARVEPRHKIRIVSAWQARGEVVAMTGDGVNDAPALKAADIGIAVGAGTEVAKQASDVVILDNDLGTITAAIEQGRVIFDNIRKTTVYLLAGSSTEIVLISVSMFMGLPLPLLAVHILWINLVADSFPGIGLTLEPEEKDVMNIAPRGRTEPVLNKQMLSMVVFVAIITNIVLVGLYLWLLGAGLPIELVRTMMFVAVGVDTLIYVFSMRSFRRTIFTMNPFSNVYLLLGVCVGLVILMAAVMIPGLRELMELEVLRLSDWGLLLMMGVLKLVAIEIAKEVFILREKND